MKDLNSLERKIELLERIADLLLRLQAGRDYGAKIRELERAADRLERMS